MSIPLATALAYAHHIVKWLGPFCERIEVAGSIRRRRPTVGDVDIVCIPRCAEREVKVDMFTTIKARTNLCLQELVRYVRESGGRASWLGREGKPGPEPKADAKYALLQLPKVQLDVWFADEGTWATRLLCRTGSVQHNIWLCDRAKLFFGHWQPYEGLRIRGQDVQAESEEDIYRALKLPWIPPERREAQFLGEFEKPVRSNV